MKKLRFDNRYLESARPWHPESQGIKDSSRADKQALHQSSQHIQSKQDTACKPSALAMPKTTANTKYEDVWSETDALLLRIRQAKPGATAGDDTEQTAADENKIPAKPNKRAVVRVRVSHSTHWPKALLPVYWS